MSIYVYVTRKPDPLEEDGPDISEQEWTEAIKGDPDLSIVDPPDRRPRDRRIYAAWKSYPGGYTAWLALSGGSIEVKGLDDVLLTKLRYFATKLNGRIVSEMGEEFY